MLKSDILKKLGHKHKNLSESDVEQIFNIFIKKTLYALKENKNVELVLPWIDWAYSSTKSNFQK